MAEAQANPGVFVEKVYNQKPLRSALAYLPPAEFERGLLAQPNNGNDIVDPSTGGVR